MMEENMKEPGIIIYLMVKDHIVGLMEQVIRENSMKGKCMDMAHMYGVIEQPWKLAGTSESLTAKENSPMEEFHVMESGIMARE